VSTIRDIARSAGVSVSTASLALNGDARVRAETRARVLAAASALDYHPTLAARSLSHGRTWSVHLLYPGEGTMSTGFFSRFVRGLHDGARDRGASLALSVPVDADEAQATLRRMIRERWADGVVFMNLDPDDPLLAMAHDHGFPHVLIGRAARDDVPTVDNDNRAVALDVTRALLGRGCRHLRLLNGPDGQAFTRERAQGFAEAHRDAGMPLNADAVTFTDGRPEGGEEAVAGWLASGAPLDGVVAVSDSLAVAALHALRQHGVSVPGQVRLFGMNNDDIGRFTSPSLSSVELHAQDLGLEAAALLLDQVDGRRLLPVRRLVGHELVERETGA
jgi:DNA-binding LacI/PurR family transcriptional regulator